jgi:CheY-like chemotaxis protein
MKNILLAENNAFLINVYGNQLKKSGYNISVAPNGEAVISQTKSAGPDLLILDDNIPKIDGFSVLKILRENPGLKELKVVTLSDSNQEENINNELEFGVIKSLSKSENTAEEIAEEIKQILN